MWKDYKKGALQYRALFEPIREFKIKQKQIMMYHGLILALREVEKRMDEPTVLFAKDYLELWHFLQSQFLDHSQAIFTKVKVSWNSQLNERDVYIGVSRFKPNSNELDLDAACMVNGEFDMDEDMREGQHRYVKSFINNIIKAL